VADLQELSKLFTELQSEVGTLIKRKTDFTRENIKLEARVHYLNGRITSLEDEITTIKAKKQTAIDGLEKEISMLKKACVAAQREKQRIYTAIEVAKSTASAAQKARVAEDERLEAAISDKTHALQGIREEVEIEKGNLVVVQGDIVTANRILTALAEKVEAKKTATASKIATLDASIVAAKEKHRNVVSKLEDTQDELEEIDQKLTQKRIEAEAHDKKRQEFQEYEKRATTALEARESAILEREKELDRQVTLAGRRHGILDKAR
jgi:chromosome segregation ATPase